MTGECLIRLFYKLTGAKISPQLAEEHYADNRQKEENLGEGYILSQYAKALSGFQFGRVSVSYAGCGAVAIYNALRFLHMPVPFSQVIRELEKSGLLSLRGKMGTDPCRLLRILEKLTPDASTGNWRRFRDPQQLEIWKDLADKETENEGKAEKEKRTEKEKITGTEKKTAAILAIWNDRKHPGKGMHFYMLYAAEDGWKAMNRQDGAKPEKVYATVADSVGKGRLILGYAYLQGIC